MKVGIIIPNYNGKRLLEKNLPKVIQEIKKLSNLEIELIVIDDNSNDNSVQWLTDCRKKLKNVKLKILRNQKNFGFSSTVNRGVREAKGEIVVLLNTDVFPEEGFLESVLPHFKDPKVFAVGLLDKSVEGEKIVRRGRGIGEWQRGFYVHRRGEVDRTDTAWVSGGSGAFRKSVWEKLGGFDEIYNPFYWEDIDLSYRAKKAGYRILFEPKSIVIHEHEKGIIKRQFPIWKIKSISFRNQFLFVWKNANHSQLIFHFLWLPHHFVKSILRLDFCFWLGFLWAIKRKLIFRK